jgi:hypothetical protein
MMHADDDHDELMRAWIDNRLLEQVEDYLGRGRRLAGSDHAVLRRHWIAAMKLWSAKAANAEDHKLREDIQAEMQLRGHRLPYELVKEELAKLTTMSSAFMDGLGPDDRARISRTLGGQVEAFHASIKQRLKN